MGEFLEPGVVDVPAGFFEVLEHVVFGSGSPEVFEGVAHGEGHVAGVVPCFTGEGGVGGVVGGVVDHVAGLVGGLGAGAAGVGGHCGVPFRGKAPPCWRGLSGLVWVSCDGGLRGCLGRPFLG